MNRALLLSIAACFCLAAAPALAGDATSTRGHGAVTTGVHQDAGKKYPMTAVDFRALVSAKREKARAKMEEHIASKSLPKDKADELRARFKAANAQIDAKVDEVCADGTVTKEEAQAVHALSRSLFHHGHDQEKR